MAGAREALLFVVEHESGAQRFSIRRLAYYCLDLSALFETERVVPVVVFVGRSSLRRVRRLALGGDRHVYLRFEYLACELGALPAVRYFSSHNLVARLNLPNMAYDHADRLEVYAQAIRGLRELEPDPERQRKYADFVDIYAGLDDNERERFGSRYPEEEATVSTLTERMEAKGRRQGEAAVLIRQMERKFGDLTDAQRERIEAADAETLLMWSERVLTATAPERVLD